jgi:hypothetical protein
VNSLGAIWSTLRQVVVDPTSNLTAAVLLLAAIVLLALIIVIALLLWVTGGRRPEHDEDGEPAERDEDEYEYPELSAELAPDLPGERRGLAKKAAKPAGPISRWLAGTGGTVAIWSIVALAVVGAYIGTSTDQYCADACHGRSAAVKSRAKDPHKSVACVSCHEDGGVAGIGGSAFQRTSHLVQRLAPSIHAYAGGVPSSRCLACHGTVTSNVVTIEDLGVRVSHKQPLAGGMSCDDCHENAGHGGTLAKGMAPCVSCHDGKKASSECKTCHVSDTSKAVRASDRRRMFPRIGLGPVTNCDGCHDQTTCDACHGLRMPHSARFMQWEHARYAGFSKRQLCYRCHVSSQCGGSCHGGLDAHGPGWATRHQGAPRDSTCSCHWSRLPDEGKAKGSFCAVCH